VARTIEIVDEIDGGSYDIRLAFHLGPDIHAELDGTSAVLKWPGTSAPAGTARLELPARLDWSLRRGETEPILGWYAYGLGRRTPAFTLIGQGRSVPHIPLSTCLAFHDEEHLSIPAAAVSAVSSRMPSPKLP
jgi:hypothetical protein